MLAAPESSRCFMHHPSPHGSTFPGSVFSLLSSTLRSMRFGLLYTRRGHGETQWLTRFLGSGSTLMVGPGFGTGMRLGAAGRMISGTEVLVGRGALSLHGSLRSAWNRLTQSGSTSAVSSCDVCLAWVRPCPIEVQAIGFAALCAAPASALSVLVRPGLCTPSRFMAFAGGKVTRAGFPMSGVLEALPVPHSSVSSPAACRRM